MEVRMPAEYKTEPRRFSDLTNVSVLGSFVLGLLLTVGTYLMVGSYLADFDYIPIYSYLYEQGLIPHICTVLFWTAISNMVLKTFKIRKESEAFKIFQEKFPEIANSTHSHIGMERIANWEKPCKVYLQRSESLCSLIAWKRQLRASKTPPLP